MSEPTHRPAPAEERPVPFLDLAAMHDEQRVELDAAWREVTAANAFIGGPHLDRFESEWAAYCGVDHCIGVANGTDALELAFAGLGIGPGDEVVVPANTFIATAEAVTAVGARPVFVDVDPATLLLTPAIAEAALTPATAAIVAVHLYGQMADVEALAALARTAGVALVEDAAQAHGATWRGRKAGWFGDVATYSFYPGKNLGAFGDGGAVVTRHADLADRVRLLSTHGRSPENRYRHVVDGRNSRLDGLQAAILSVKLAALDKWNAGRRRAAEGYAEALAGSPVRLVEVASEAVAVHHVAAVLLPERDAVAARLAEAGIATNLHYPVPCHRQGPFEAFAAGPLPVVEEAAATELSLPMYPHLAEADVARVSHALLEAVGDRGVGRG